MNPSAERDRCVACRSPAPCKATSALPIGAAPASPRCRQHPLLQGHHATSSAAQPVPSSLFIIALRHVPDLRAPAALETPLFFLQFHHTRHSVHPCCGPMPCGCAVNRCTFQIQHSPPASLHKCTAAIQARAPGSAVYGCALPSELWAAACMPVLLSCAQLNFNGGRRARLSLWRARLVHKRLTNLLDRDVCCAAVQTRSVR